MSIQIDAIDAYYKAHQTQQEADTGQRRIEWTESASQQSLHRLGKKQRVLARLLQGPATTADLCKITPAYSQRMGDLKREGYQIHREDHVGPDGEWSLYLLTGVPEP